MNREDNILVRIGGLHKYDMLTYQIEKYQLWYNSLSEEEKKGEVGLDIKRKLRLWDEIINKNL